MAIVVAFGVTFAYPILGVYVTREHPRFLPALHGAQERIGKFLITPAATIALLAGFYLASDRHYMGKVWVIVPLVILIALLGLGGAFFAPNERRAAELSARDVAAAGAGRPGHALARVQRALRARGEDGRAGFGPRPRRHLLHGGEARRLLIRRTRA